MIASAKRDESKSVNESEYPKIAFLNVDASLSFDEYELSQYNHFISKQDYKTYGKIEYYSDRTKYFLKTFRGGRPGEVLVNPYSPFAKAEDLSTVSKTRGTRFCEYQEVSRDHFDTYFKYLKGRNPINFKVVEKAIVNGEGMKNG